jgi:hypothetical protein
VGPFSSSGSLIPWSERDTGRSKRTKTWLNKNACNSFAELRRTCDDRMALQPDIVAACGPLTKDELEDFEQRVQAHEAALSAGK